jgi:hypothetical protein
MLFWCLQNRVRINFMQVGETRINLHVNVRDHQATWLGGFNSELSI